MTDPHKRTTSVKRTTPRRQTSEEAPYKARPPPKTQYSIGELANEFAITTRALRFYEVRGLLTPDRRGTTRVYSPDDRKRLALILRAKNLGLSLDSIGDHLAIHDHARAGPAELEALRERTDQHIAVLTTKRNDLQSTLTELRRLRAAIVARLPPARSRN
jgi:DNA-binding transcriptional MerR regulator